MLSRQGKYKGKATSPCLPLRQPVNENQHLLVRLPIHSPNHRATGLAPHLNPISIHYTSRSTQGKCKDKARSRCLPLQLPLNEGRMSVIITAPFHPSIRPFIRAWIHLSSHLMTELAGRHRCACYVPCCPVRQMRRTGNANARPMQRTANAKAR